MSDLDQFFEFRSLIALRASENIERIDQLGREFAFGRAKVIVSKINTFLSSLTEEVINFAPVGIWNQLRGIEDAIRNTLDAIVSFDPNRDSPRQYKDALEGDLESQFNDLFRALAPLVGASGAISSSGQIQEDARKAADEARRIISDAQALIEKQAAEMAELLESTKDKAAEVVSTVEAEHFGEAADQYGDASNRWLIATIFLAAVMLLAATSALIFAISGGYKGLDAASTTQVAIAKFILLGILAYVTNICARNYFANKHNQTVNKHRKNAILSYRALVAPTSSAEHRDIILTHAASAVFAPQDSAYVKQSSSAPDIPSTVIGSVIKSAGA